MRFITEKRRRVKWLCQQQPVPGVLDQAAAGLHEPLLQVRQRPMLDLPRQHQPTPEVSQVVSDHAQPEAHFVGREPMARQPGHLDRPLAFLDPLVRIYAASSSLRCPLWKFTIGI